MFAFSPDSRAAKPPAKGDADFPARLVPSHHSAKVYDLVVLQPRRAAFSQGQVRAKRKALRAHAAPIDASAALICRSDKIVRMRSQWAT
jgi:hypothetical protein